MAEERSKIKEGKRRNLDEIEEELEWANKYLEIAPLNSWTSGYVEALNWVLMNTDFSISTYVKAEEWGYVKAEEWAKEKRERFKKDFEDREE